MSEQQLAQHQRTIDQIDGVLNSSAGHWRDLLDPARTAMSGFDALSFFGDTGSLSTQVHVLSVLQNLAYHDVDTGGVTDIGDWTLLKWLRLLQDHPQDVEVLKGTADTHSLHASSDTDCRHRQMVAEQSTAVASTRSQT